MTVAEVFDNRRNQLKARRNTYPAVDVDNLLEYAGGGLRELEAQIAGLETRVAGLDTETDDDRRNRVTRAALAQQAAETVLAAAEQRADVTVHAAQLQGQRIIEEAHQRAANIQPAGGLPARPDPTGDQVQDALLEAEWLDQLRAFTADAAEALRPKIRDAIAGLQRADAALDGVPALPAAPAKTA